MESDINYTLPNPFGCILILFYFVLFSLEQGRGISVVGVHGSGALEGTVAVSVSAVVADNDPSAAQAVAEVLHASAISATAVDADSSESLPPNQSQGHKPLLLVGVDIYVPDQNGVLAPSHILCYDDAPWISTALSQRNGAIRFVNKALDIEEAKVLGAKSLREQLFSGDEIVCPGPKSLRNLLGRDVAADCILDLISLADKLRGNAFHIHYDAR